MKSVWTDEAIASAKKHNAAQLSRREIANEIFADTGMRFSRNAVIGKLTRLGEVCPKPKEARNKPVSRPARVIGRNSQPILERLRGSASGALRPGRFKRLYIETNNSLPLTEQRPPLHIPFLERKEGECAFICSAPREPVTVCGHGQALIWRDTVEVSSSYCGFHHNITHRPDAPRTRVAA